MPDSSQKQCAFTPQHLAAAKDLADYIAAWGPRHELDAFELLYTLSQFAADAAVSMGLPADEWVPLLMESYGQSLDALPPPQPAGNQRKRTPSHNRAKAGRRRQRQARRKGRTD